MEQASYKERRQALKRRLLERGIDDLSPNETLELVLSFATNRDTEPIAAELLYRFGSVLRVLDAPASALCGIDGVSESAVVLFKMIPQILQSYSPPQPGRIPFEESCLQIFLQAHYCLVSLATISSIVFCTCSRTSSLSIPPRIGSPMIVPLRSTKIVVGNAIIFDAYCPASLLESK